MHVSYPAYKCLKSLFVFSAKEMVTSYDHDQNATLKARLDTQYTQHMIPISNARSEL